MKSLLIVFLGDEYNVKGFENKSFIKLIGNNKINIT